MTPTQTKQVKDYSWQGKINLGEALQSALAAPQPASKPQALVSEHSKATVVLSDGAKLHVLATKAREHSDYLGRLAIAADNTSRLQIAAEEAIAAAKGAAEDLNKVILQCPTDAGFVGIISDACMLSNAILLPVLDEPANEPEPELELASPEIVELCRKIFLISNSEDGMKELAMADIARTIEDGLEAIGTPKVIIN